MKPLLALRIPLKPVSWNTLARKNRWTYTAVFGAWKRETYAVILENRPPRIEGPVRIVVTGLFRTKRKHDPDNLLVKPVLDQIVAQGVLPEDNSAVVSEVVLRVRTGAPKDELLIEIYSDS